MASVVDVVIIGAGAAGLTAAYDFTDYPDLSFAVLEAGPGLGGRLQKLEDFAGYDSPIDIGGEWIHVDPDILNEIAWEETVTDEVETVPYLDTFQIWDDGEWTPTPYGEGDYKFVDYTWYDFFNDYIAPSSAGNMFYDCQVNSVDWSSTSVQVACVDGRRWSAKHVIVTPSLQILQDVDLDFQPSLPQATQSAINRMTFATGLKVFMTFNSNFYPEAFSRWVDILDLSVGERMYYDETYGQDSDLNVMGIFAVGSPAEPYVDKSDQEIVQMILSELDEIFDGQATGNYTGNFFVQNWAKEPFVRGAYSYHEEYDAIDELRGPLDDKIFFAGEAVPAEGYGFGFAHGAALSGRFAAERVISLLHSAAAAPGGESSGPSTTGGKSTSSSGGTTPFSAQIMFQTAVATVLSFFWIG